MNDRFRDRLSEYLDGTLSPADAVRVEAHLAECRGCAETLEGLRTVVARAAALPLRRPPGDLWPGIAARIAAGVGDEGSRVEGEASGEAGDGGRAPARRVRRVSLSIPQLAAAAGLLVALSGAGSWLALRAATDDARTVADAGDVPGGAFVSTGAADAGEADRYAAAVRDLEAALFDAATPLPAETAAKIRRNLAVIDRAIEDAVRALEEAPADAYIQQHLTATRRRKVEFLRSTVRLVSQT